MMTRSLAPPLAVHQQDFSKIQSVHEQPVTSAIVEPQAGALVDAGDTVTAKGFAWSGGGRGIVRVDVSADGTLMVDRTHLRMSSHGGSPLSVARSFTRA